MAKYVHLFETVNEFNSARTPDNYVEPWLSYTKENSGLTFNKTEYEKLLETPLTFNIISAGTIVWKAQNTAYTTTIEYSMDSGSTWTSITSSKEGTSISVNPGDVIQFRGDNATYSSGSTRYNSFRASTAIFEAEGNIMSIIDSTGFSRATALQSAYTFVRLFSDCAGLMNVSNLILPASTLADYCYQYMFNDCASLTTAPVLSATTLASRCCFSMFSDCTSLTTAPELPATTLASSCYSNMFFGCISLTTAPSLPATTLADSCYSNMFSGCTSLTTAPELPATTLALKCYYNMFVGCTSLTAGPLSVGNSATTLAPQCCYSMFQSCTSLTTAPELPAATLADYCYQYMFSGCTSLTTAPELPATTLAKYCYQYMFQGCTSLNYIKCLATDISAGNCTYQWVAGVAATGTFVKNPNITEQTWGRGTSGIPANWTVQDA